LAGRQVLVVGAGSMGRMTAGAAARRGAEVLVTNRTAARAAAVAGDVGGRAVPWPGSLGQVAGVVVALSGPWPVESLVAQGVPVVDLSSPSAVGAALQEALDDLFLSVDDLAFDEQSQLRDGLRDRLESLVADSGRDYCRWLRAREALPAIQGMAEAVEQRRRSEMTWLLRRLPELSESEAALIEQMSHRLVGGILHAPRTALNLDETGELGRAARELFGV
jgi:glutamyl-tRNA reductase